MSKMITDRKPPLAKKSPTRLGPRRVLRSNTTTSLQIPPGGLNPTWEEEEEEEEAGMFRSISCELQALAKMVHGNSSSSSSSLGGQSITVSAKVAPIGLERGRFYEEYSARRNQRLNNRRRNSNTILINSNKLGDACFRTPSSKMVGLGVTATKRKKKASSLEEGLTTFNTNNTVTRSSAAASAAAPRYMLRSMSKEKRNPPAPPTLLLNSVVASRARRTRPI